MTTTTIPVFVQNAPGHALQISQHASFWGGQLWAALLGAVVGAVVGGTISAVSTLKVAQHERITERRILLYETLIPKALGPESDEPGLFDRIYRTAFTAGKKERQDIQPVERARRDKEQLTFETVRYRQQQNVSPGDAEANKIRADQASFEQRSKEVSERLTQALKTYYSQLESRL